MKVLIIGSGGREHALAWAISKSPLLSELICAPGNAGMEDIARCAALNAADHEAVIAFCRAEKVDYVVIGPELPLVAGLVDDLKEAGIEAFGPSGAAAQLEGSKGFTKELCRENDIPTAEYGRFFDARSAARYIDRVGAPVVVKADGLAAGKGVTVAMTTDAALSAIDDIFAGKFGEAGASLVIEEYLTGEEASFFALVDGRSILPLATAQDHKRVGDGDHGPNTGGMGAYSPAPVMSDTLCQATMDEIIRPTVRALAEAGTPYSGVLYAGLMIDEEGPKLIEYNVRFGDPECQVLAMRLDDDLLELMLASSRGGLDKMSVHWRDEAALTVVMAADGYPGSYRKGTEIRGLREASADDKVMIFHAGTARADGRIVSAGGRVLNVTALGATVAEAQARAYAAIDKIDWPEGFCRRDIGWRAVAREQAEGTS
ncbi:MAG TPA: phosphoribosylamine--glycine ligase [Hyphomicrobiales bacterium]|nr:phosphoribosylamine--glycine ligase [Hyphomicrobiales bacterium]